MEQQILDFLKGLEFGPTALLLLGLAAGIEYVFPPFPGDSITLFGAVLVGLEREASGGAWPWPPVFAALTVGSLVGMAIDHGFGRFVGSRDAEWRERYGWWRKAGAAIDRALPFFERRPTVYLILNRFLPSIRALFFVAAGMVRIPLWRVLVFGGLSAVAWNALLFGLGALLGRNWPLLVSLLRSYNFVLWILLAIGIALLILRARRRAPKAGP